MVITTLVPIVRFSLLLETWELPVAVPISSAVTITFRAQQTSVFSRTHCLAIMAYQQALGSTGHVSGARIMTGSRDVSIQ